ncbi:MAG: hypothetical protein ACFFB5_07300 [Promethearchaeota archaeon]
MFNRITLAKVRILSQKDLNLFIIAILFISFTSAAVGSFVIGIKPEDFFLGEEEDILVITPSGTTTPMTGTVPLSFVYDVEKLEGVEIISAEVLTAVIVQNLDESAIIVRGITSKFLDITQQINLEGEWFDQLSSDSNMSITLGAVAGKSLAEEHELAIGSRLTLVSTLTPMTVTVTIEGIITTDSPMDTELILPLATAQALKGILSDFVSFIRVKVDPSVVTKSQLKTIVKGEYEVPIIVRSHDFIENFNNVYVLVYSLAGELLLTTDLSSDGTGTLQLSFGSYRLIADSKNIQQSSPVEVFIYQPLPSPVTLWVGKTRKDLKINVTYNNHPAINARVTLREKFHPDMIYTGVTQSDGIVTFYNLITSYYSVTVLYKGLLERFEVNHNSIESNSDIKTRFRISNDDTINVELKNFLQIEVLNATTEEEIDGGKIQLINSSNPTQLLYPTNNLTWLQYDSKEILYIDEPGIYLVNYSIGEKVRSWNQTISANTSNQIYIGKGKLEINVLGYKGEVIENVNVSIYSKGVLIDYMKTNSQSKVIFELETGFNYMVTAENPQNNNSISTTIFFDSSTIIPLKFLSPNQTEIYWVEIRAYNGTIETLELNGLSNCKIDLYNDSEIINTSFTNDDGIVRFLLNNSGNYYLNATYNHYKWHKEIEISQETTFVNIPLGDVKLKFLFRTSSNIPIEGTNVTIFYNGSIFKKFTTNTSGKSVVTIPLGNYSISIEHFDFKREFNVSFMESQVYIVGETLDLTGKLILKVMSSEGRRIVGARIVIQNILFNISRTGITTQNATITFLDLPWGNYSVTALIRNTVYETVLISFAEEKKSISLTLKMPTEINYDLASSVNRRGRTNIDVVESTDYMESFLGGALEVAKTSLIALVLIIAALSLLNVSSVISYPIIMNYRSLQSIKRLGGSLMQIYIMISVQLVIMSVFASFLGSMMGILMMTQIELFQSTNIGGLIIFPSSDLSIIFGIILSNIIVILIKTRQTLSDIL